MSEGETANRWITDLEAEDYSVRMKACRELAEMGADASNAVPMLTKVHLEDSDEYVRHFAKHALDRIQSALKAVDGTVEQLLED